MRSKRSTAALTAVSASCVLVTSSFAVSRLSASPTAFETASGLRPVATTLWPAASAAFVNSTPIPRPAPVMNQTFLSLMSEPSVGSLVRSPRKHRFVRSESPCPSGYWQCLPGRGLRGYPRSMDAKSEIREFLTSRRAKITPEQAGLTAYGPRRVPGLRREEVAVLAGVSVPYYTRLERGDLSGVSESVLEALARALQLDDAERAHLFDLARAAAPMAKRRRRSAPKQIRPSVQRLPMRSPAHPRSSRTAASTSLPPTSLDAPCTRS